MTRMTFLFFRFGIWLLLLLLFALPARSQNLVSGRVIAVESGDQVQVQFEGWQVSVRLHGIDAPDQPADLANRVRLYVARRLENTTVKIEIRGTGTRQTVYGEIFPADSTKESLNQEMVRNGLAVWARQYAPQRTDLGALEEEAKRAVRGMWGDPSGNNLPVPPPTAEKVASAPAATPIAPPTQAPPVPEVVATPIPTAPPQVPIQATPAPKPSVPETKPHVWQMSDIVLPALIFLTMVVFVLYQRFGGWNTARFPSQLLASLLIAGAGILLFPLLILLVTNKIPASPAVAITSLAMPLGLVALWSATVISRKEQLLRLTPQQPIAQLRPGLVRIAGETTAPNGLVESSIGNIPAIYLREVTWKCETRSDRPLNSRPNRRSTPHEWVVLREDTQTVDFQVTDESGSIMVDANKASFRPLRVARFYNDIPVEQFFDNPYSGDIRTEIFFIPATANVVVWGRCYTPVASNADTAEPRIGYDPLSEILTIVEENPARIFTSRPLLGLGLTLVAVVLTAVVGYCLLNPSFLAGYLALPSSLLTNPIFWVITFFLGILALVGIVLTHRVLQKRYRSLRSAATDLDTAFLQRRSRLSEILPTLTERLPDMSDTISRIIKALLYTEQSVYTPERIAAEQEVSNYVAHLLEVMERDNSHDSEIADSRIELRARETYITEARERCNAAAYAWNLTIAPFPTHLFAAALGYDPVPLFNGPGSKR